MDYKILATTAPEYDQDTLLLGYCREPQHQKSNLKNKLETLLVKPSIIANSVEFEKILLRCPNLVSIQIGGYLDEEASVDFNLESYAKILQLITKYCGGRLECLTLFFNRNSQLEEDEILKFLDEKDNHPHAKIWEDFVDAVSPSLKHLIFVGTNFTYNIPHFALKWLLENAPNLENIEGSYSSKATIDTEMAFLCLKDDDAGFIISLEIGLDNFSEKSDLSELKEFKNLRHLKLNYKDSSQLRDTLNFESLEKLVTLTISPPEVEDDKGVCCDTLKTEPNENPIDFKFPDSSKLRTLVIRGLVLSDCFWTGIGNRVPFLRDFIYQAAHSVSNTFNALSPFIELEFLQYLVLEMPWNFVEDDVIGLLQSKRGRFHLDLYNVQENDPVKNFEKIVEFLNNDEWLKDRQDKFGLGIEYPNYIPDKGTDAGFVKQVENGLEIHWGKDEEIGTWILKACHEI